MLLTLFVATAPSLGFSELNRYREAGIWISILRSGKQRLPRNLNCETQLYAVRRI